MAVLKRRRTKGRDDSGRRVAGRPEYGALGIFALLMTAAPLAFGAVDQVVQVALLVLFALGLALRPPTVIRLTGRMNALLLLLAALLLAKEFAPSVLFGHTTWRTSLTQNFGLEFPWTHHPEPSRAVDALLSAGLAILWLLWVRTLAERRENRPWLVWSLAGAAAVVALVSFAMRTTDASAIYGLRYTPGWRGFGPFPNRNHTASFLAMGVVMACGGAVWSLLRRNYLAMTASLGLGALSLAGLLATQSRGGVLALGVGLALYAGFCLVKFRSRRASAIIAAIALVAAALVLATGSKAFARFSAPDSAVSNDTRKAIWADTLKMWQDAPLLGHGLGSFGSVFPLYQKIELDNQVVLHPESSWLQWLSELGLVPLALAVGAGGALVVRHGRGALGSRRSFFLYAAGFSSAGALLCHCAIDVPGHRWATAAFALAALGLACPRLRQPSSQESEWQIHAPHGRLARRAALVPLAVAILWALPFWYDWPAWSPVTLQRRLANSESTWRAQAVSLQRELSAFPLSSPLHEAVGLAQLRSGAPEAEWQQHWQTALELSPGSWALPMQFARACGARWPDLAFNYWQVAIERGGARAEEIFANAQQETASFPQANALWASYVEAHPELALQHAATLPGEQARAAFMLWWEARGRRVETPLTPRETKVFYFLAPQFSTPAQLTQFMHTRPALVAQEFRACARVLHGWGQDQQAWQLLSTRVHEPELAPAGASNARPEMERRLRLSPGSSSGAQALAAVCLAQGDTAAAQEVILTFAARPEALPFFTRKAAYIRMRQGQLGQAVELMLREKD